MPLASPIDNSIPLFLLGCIGIFGLSKVSRHLNNQDENFIREKECDNQVDNKRFSNLQINSLNQQEALAIRREKRYYGRRKKVVPLTLVTGPLGAGKTTLLNHILTKANGLKIGVIVNDFAQLNVDYENLKSDWKTRQKKLNQQNAFLPDASIVELSNGCICCSLKVGLSKAILQVSKDVDYLIVETSGLSDPLQMVCRLDEIIQENYGPNRTFGGLALRLHNVIAVIEPDFLSMKESSNSENFSFLRSAGLLLLNKADLLSAEQKANLLQDLIKMCNPETSVLPCVYCNVNLVDILDLEAVEPSVEALNRKQRGTKRDKLVTYKVRNFANSRSYGIAQHKMVTGLGSSHLNNYKSFVFLGSVNTTGGFSMARLQNLFMDERWRMHVVRLKGTVCFQHDLNNRYSIQMSGRQRIEVLNLGPWVSTRRNELACVVDVALNDEIHKQLLGLLECCVVGQLEYTKCFQYPATTISNSDFTTCCEKDFADAVQGYKDSITYFRLTGTERFRMTEEQLEKKYCVDLRRANELFVRHVNNLEGSSLFLAPSHDFNGCVVMSTQQFQKVASHNFSTMNRALRLVFEYEFRGKIPQCNCEL